MAPRRSIAELVAGQIGRALGLPVPELVIAELPEAIARAESHDEIRDLLGWSVGLNIGLAFVPGALGPDLAHAPAEGPDWSAEVVWFDDLVVNPDRTPRNANLVVHDGRTWLIDHGSALYVHHAWADPDEHAVGPSSASPNMCCSRSPARSWRPMRASHPGWIAPPSTRSSPRSLPAG